MKKAILITSFGTSYEDTRIKTLDAIENRIREEFGNEYEVRRAYTSNRIIKKLRERDGILIDTPSEAIEKLKNEDFEKVIVQPTHIIPGKEYEYIKEYMTHNFKGDFKKLSVGRPLLYFKCEEEGLDDYLEVVEVLAEEINKHENIIFMGHGSNHTVTESYGFLEDVIRKQGFKNAYVATIEGYPTLHRAIQSLEEKGAEEVTLMPFLIVAGNHVRNDMASDEKNSWKSILESKGFKVNIVLKGLGEYKGVQDIFVNRVRDAINEEFKTIDNTKK